MPRRATPPLAETPSPPLRATGCALAVLLSNCLGGQTGGEHDGTGGRGVVAVDADCQAQTESLAFEAQSPVGISGADALAAFGGTHAASLSWSDTTDLVAYGPEHGESTIELSIVSGGSLVRSIRYERSTPTDPARAGAGGSTSADSADTEGCATARIDLDVAVQLTSGGTALSETFDATLEVYSATSAQLSKQLDLSTLSGTFAVNAPAGYSTRELRVQASFEDGAFRGQLSGELQGPSSSEPEASKASPLIIQYAYWPANTGELIGPSP